MGETVGMLPSVPEEPRSPALRASDDDRSQVVDVLRGACADGRITLDEFSDRVGQAYLRTVDSQSEELDCTGLFLAIGHTPNTDFLKGQLELDDKGYIRWTKPQRCHTSVEGVFAAGDVADPVYKQAVTAAGMGCKAALDAERWLALQNIH